MNIEVTFHGLILVLVLCWVSGVCSLKLWHDRKVGEVKEK